MDAIIIDFSKAFGLVPYDRLITKIAATGLDLTVTGWIREFLLGRTQRVGVDEQISEEIAVTSGVPQGSVLGPLLFLAYVMIFGEMLSIILGYFQMTAHYIGK